jgi:DNA repair protein RecO (recombination protein O)
LQELGYGLTLDHDSDGWRSHVAEAYYTYRMEQGPVRLEHAEAAQAW